MSRKRSLPVLGVIVGVLVFAVADAAIKGRHGGTGNTVGNISATWALLPLVTGALLASKRRALTGALVGASSSASALACYALVRAGLYPGIGSHDVAGILGNRWLLLGLVGGAMLGAIGAQLVARRRWDIVVAFGASLLMMEPVGRMVWALSRGQSARALVPHPTIWAMETVCGCILVLILCARRVFSSHTR